MSHLTPHRTRDRANGFRWFLVVVFGLLTLQFFRVQVVDNDRYRLRAQDNRLREVTLAAPRGFILDRSGQVIAENAPGYTVKLFATSADSLSAMLERFQRIVALDSGTVRQVLARYRSAPYQPATVLASSSFDIIARLEEHRMSLPGLVVQTEPRRRYPGGKAVAHIVGYVGEVTERELDVDRFPGARPGTIVGKDGVEQVYDSILRGTDGVRFIEVNARGRMVREEAAAPSRPPVAGNVLHTTIDLPLQMYVDSIWEATFPGTRGALVALRPDGGILALYSTPSFDPNDFIGGISSAKYAELTSDSAGKPLLNRAIRGTYPPASPFKLATAAIALRKGLVTMSSRMDQPCRGGFRFGNRVWKCWKREGHGSLDLTGAIAASCDVYFYQLGLRIGLGPLLEEGVRMGFNDRTGIDLESEVRSSFPPSTAYYDRLYGPRGWTTAVTLNLSIGQGENAQSLINMVSFYQALAGDGVIRAPHLVTERPDQKPVDLDLTTEVLQGLRKAMSDVVQYGTAAASRGREINMAGKTGTAQNPHGKDHGWFMGFAPADKPEIVVGALLEEGLHGSTVAPLVAKVIRRFLEPGARDVPQQIRLLFPADTSPRDVGLEPDTLVRRP